MTAMLHTLTAACLLVALSAFVSGQVYEDLESTYGVPVDAPEEDVDTYGGDGLDYGDGSETNGDDYLEYEDYFTDDGDFYLNISFSAETLKQLYTCLCLGASEECTIHYRVEGHTWVVHLIEKLGFLHAGSDHCKYYQCTHAASSRKISCSQVEQRSTVCGEGGSAQFFQQTTHECCGATCVGLFWESEEEELTFLKDTPDMQSCNQSCLCPTNGEDGTSVVKVTEPSVLNGTLDRYIIQKTTSNKLLNSQKADSQPATTSSKGGGVSTAASTEGGSVDENKKSGSAVNGTNMGRSPSYEIRQKMEKTIILATIVAIVSAVIVAGCILVGIMIFRRRNQRSMKLNSSEKPSENVTAHSSRSHFSSPTASDGHLTHYRPAATDNVAATSLHEYQESPTFPGNSKNGAKVLESSYIGTGNSNRPRQNIVHSKPRDRAQPIDTQNNDSGFANKPNHSEGKFSENPSIPRGGSRPPSQERSNQMNDQESDKSWSKGSSNPRNGDSARLIDDKRDADNRVLIRREPNYKGTATGKGSDDQESRQPLLTFRKIHESVV